MTERLLGGWKRIAGFIDTCVKTAKKYHKLYGMPVRRGPQRSVYGIPEEIITWLKEFDGLRKRFDLERIERRFHFDRDTGRFVRKTRRH